MGVGLAAAAAAPCRVGKVAAAAKTAAVARLVAATAVEIRAGVAGGGGRGCLPGG